MEIRTKVHTIFLLVGPTECGKTTFAREVLMPRLRLADEASGVRANVQYLSSDDMRRELLGYEHDKYDQAMLETSSHAFRLLFERLRLVTSFPVNAEFVIVDTTGLAEDVRRQVRETAQENHYRVEAIVFDYRHREDYYASERSKKLITNHVNRMRREVLPVLSREGYDFIHKVRAKTFYRPGQGEANPEYRVAVEDWEEYASCLLPQSGRYVVIGDVHECVETLQQLLVRCGFRVEDGKVVAAADKAGDLQPVLVGDWIDKGKRTRGIVEFLYANKDRFRFVTGNHENFALKYVRGEIKGVDAELLRTYFDSVAVLSGDAELFAKFAELASLAKPFYRYRGGRGPSFYVTHAPCRNKYIGKLDAESVRRQRNFRVDRDAPVEPQLAFLREEAVGNHPYHIFGHVAARRAFRIHNKIHVDTGCAYGNALTAVRINAGSGPAYTSCRAVESPAVAGTGAVADLAAAAAAAAQELPDLFREEKKVALHELDDESVRRLDYCSRHKINYISGTMSPADKDEAAGELESLRRGLDYFAARGVREVVLQPKYMGSRCNVYLYRRADRSYAVSRNGYRVSGVDLTPVYERLLRKFGGYMEANEVDVLLLDGELLPWKALGDGLIQRQFRTIGAALETEQAFLRRHGFEETLGKLASDWEASGFEQDRSRLPKAALSDKYGFHVYQNFKHMRDIRKSYVPLADHEEAYRVYRRQLELYAGDGELEYKPFAILKEVLANGEERIPGDGDGGGIGGRGYGGSVGSEGGSEGGSGHTGRRVSEMFTFVSDDECLVLDLGEPDTVRKAEQYFFRLTAGQYMEGIVIKPEDMTDARAAPCLKVRNPEYLSIIYGYDYRFPHKYGKLMKQKQIASKLRASANEHRLGQRMLQVKLNDIAPENEAYREIAANLLFEAAKEKEIDPRL